jgi:hypothetical protein
VINEFFEKIKQLKINNWSLSSLLVDSMYITDFPSDWKWIFRGYIPSLEYVGSLAYNEADGRYEDWSMSPSVQTV